jgi:hypothetical protein
MARSYHGSDEILVDAEKLAHRGESEQRNPVGNSQRYRVPV